MLVIIVILFVCLVACFVALSSDTLLAGCLTFVVFVVYLLCVGLYLPPNLLC